MFICNSLKMHVNKKLPLPFLAWLIQYSRRHGSLAENRLCYDLVTKRLRNAVWWRLLSIEPFSTLSHCTACCH